MSNQHNDHWSRREFLAKLGLAGSAALFGLQSDVFAAEPPPETTRSGLSGALISVSPPYTWLKSSCAAKGLPMSSTSRALADKTTSSLPPPGRPISSEGSSDAILQAWTRAIRSSSCRDSTSGCFELFGNQRVRSIRDLKGKQVAITRLTSGRHIFLSVMAGHVGLDPRQDINWVTDPAAKSMQLFADGKIDAFMAFPSEPQELRAKKIGHVVVNTTTDRPWSQYFCCMVVANREFVRKHPVATKRALRAILKANGICALEPVRSARTLVDKWYPATNYDYALQTIKEIPYGQWREYDPEDTVRFYALRMNEVGIIKKSPKQILAEGTDWRFLRELKKELKA